MGEIHSAKVAALSSGSVLILLLCLVAACIKFPKLHECSKVCIVKLIPTKAHRSYLKKKLNRKKKVLATNLSLIETAQAIENQEIVLKIVFILEKVFIETMHYNFKVRN